MPGFFPFDARFLVFFLLRNDFGGDMPEVYSGHATPSIPSNRFSPNHLKLAATLCVNVSSTSRMFANFTTRLSPQEKFTAPWNLASAIQESPDQSDSNPRRLQEIGCVF